LEFGESLVGAAKRELSEETSLVATNLQLIQLINQPLEKSHYVHINFFAHHWTGKPRLLEPAKFDRWSWFPLARLPDPIGIGHQTAVKAFVNGWSYIDEGPGCDVHSHVPGSMFLAH
jgi:ADP-ribose pyrophosphatase YjhB (NUDIX family)